MSWELFKSHWMGNITNWQYGDFWIKIFGSNYNCTFVFLVPFRCSSGWNLQSGWEKHGSHGSTGVWSWADCTDNNYFIFKDSCNTLNLLATLWLFLWKCVHKRKQSAMKLSRNGFSSWWIGITKERHGMWTAN